MTRPKEEFTAPELSKKVFQVRLTLEDERRMEVLVEEIGQRQMGQVMRTALHALLDEWGIKDPRPPKSVRKSTLA